MQISEKIWTAIFFKFHKRKLQKWPPKWPCVIQLNKWINRAPKFGRFLWNLAWTFLTCHQALLSFRSVKHSGGKGEHTEHLPPTFLIDWHSTKRPIKICFACTLLGMQISHMCVYGCVRLGNPDFDFGFRISDFPIKREIQKRISTNRNPFPRRISIKRP